MITIRILQFQDQTKTRLLIALRYWEHAMVRSLVDTDILAKKSSIKKKMLFL